LATGGNIFLDQKTNPEERKTYQQHDRENRPAGTGDFALSQWWQIGSAKRAAKSLL